MNIAKALKQYANRTIIGGGGISKNKIFVLLTLIFLNNMLLAQPQWEGTDTIRRELRVIGYKKVSLNPNEVENIAEKNGEYYKNSDVTPYIEAHIPGNNDTIGDFTPSDNAIAVGKSTTSDGSRTMVSIKNSTIAFFQGNMFIQKSLRYFLDEEGVFVDGNVVYDNEKERYIFTCYRRNDGPYSNVLVLGVSDSADPRASWTIYFIDPDLMSTGTQEIIDRPQLGISKTDIFIGAQLYYTSGRGTILYQIRKTDCYSSASTLNGGYYYPVSGDPFGIVPMPSGRDILFPVGIYCAGISFSNATSASGGNEFIVYRATDSIMGSPVLQRTTVPIATFYPPKDAKQQHGPGFDLFAGDCRVQNGFYLNGILHFVFKNRYGTSYSGFRYCRYDIAANTVSYKNFGDNNLYYSHPSIASFGNSDTDKSVIIGMLKTSASSPFQICAVSCDDAMNFSSVVSIKGAGTNYFRDNSSPGQHKWGDYTGIARVYNSFCPTVAFAAEYPGNILSGYDPRSERLCHIAIINNGCSQSLQDNNAEKNPLKVYPNPVANQSTLNITIVQQEQIRLIRLFTAQGQLIQAWNENEKSVILPELPQGIYVLSVATQKGENYYEKIMVY